MVGNGGGGLGGFQFLRRSNSTTTKKASSSTLMDFPKPQTRTPMAVSTFPPPHKTQLPMRYQTQHYQNNQNSSSSNSKSPALICKRSVWVVAILSFLSVTLYLLSLVRGLQGTSSQAILSRNGNAKRYGIIIDAGSSGSRIHVFQYSPGAIPDVDLHGMESNSLKRTPGLSSFAGIFGPKKQHHPILYVSIFEGKKLLLQVMLVFLGFGGGWSICCVKRIRGKRVCHSMRLCDLLGDDCCEFPSLLCVVLNFESFCDVGVVGFCGGWSHLFIFKA
jgi:hypothetical protein